MIVTSYNNVRSPIRYASKKITSGVQKSVKVRESAVATAGHHILNCNLYYNSSMYE